MTNQLTLLGTGTCELDANRGASSALIQLQDLNVAFDFGRGTALALPRLGITQNQLRHVVISHFHPDHSSDLIPYLHAACWSRTDSRTEPLNIYGPRGIADLMARIVNLYGPNEMHRPDRFELKVHEVTQPVIEIEGRRFEFIDLPKHSNHGLAITVDDYRYALTADSYFHDQQVEFISGAEVAVVDCGHQSSDELIELAVRAQPRIMVLSHVFSNAPIEDIVRRTADRGFRGTIELGKDGMTFAMGKNPSTA